MSFVKLVFHLGPHGIRFYSPGRRRLLLLARFEECEQLACARFLLPWAGEAVQGVVDLPDEDFQTLAVPPLGAQDRHLLLQRKLEQAYRTSPYRCAQMQDAETALLAALTQPAVVDAWLDLLESQGLVLAGLVSPAVLAQRIVQRLQPLGGHLVLLSLQDGSLRQTYTQAGHVRFSRLIPPETGVELHASARIVAESLRARHYLISKRLLQLQDELDVVVLAESAVHSDIRLSGAVQENMRFSLVEPVAVLRRVGIAVGDGEDIDTTMMYAWLALRHAPLVHYAPPQRLAAFRLLRRMVRIRNGAMAVCLLAAIGATWCAYQNALLRDEQQGLLERIAELQHELSSPTLKGQQATEAELRASVDVYRQHLKHWPWLRPVLEQLSTLIESHPSLHLRELDWTFHRQEGEKPQGSSLHEGAPALVASPGSENAQERRKPYLLLALRGQIEPFDGNYRKALETLERFRGQAEQMGYEGFEWTQLPLDTRPHAALDVEPLPQSPPHAAFGARFILPRLVGEGLR